MDKDVSACSAWIFLNHVPVHGSTATGAALVAQCPDPMLACAVAWAVGGDHRAWSLRLPFPAAARVKRMVSRKRLAIDSCNVDVPFPGCLAAYVGNFRVFLIRQGEKDRQVAVGSEGRTGANPPPPLQSA